MLVAGLLVAFGANAAEYQLSAGSDLIGAVQVIEAQYEDTFVSLARRYDVGFEALRQANPDVDAWLPGEGTQIVIPTQFVLPRAERRGIIVNLPELRLYYFPDDGTNRVFTHPISIGRMDWGTPLGTTSIVAKAANPSWYPPQSIRDEHAAMNDPLPRVVPPGPDNPLGKFALRLGIPGYLIHGTNKPSGVGMRVTHGCMRMFPEDIEALYSMVPSGTRVQIVDQPIKLGWDESGLYLESHPALKDDADTEVDNDAAIAGTVDAAAEPAAELEVAATATVEVTTEPEVIDESAATELTRVFVAATQERRVQVKWDQAEEVMLAARGIPEFVSVAGTISEISAESMAADFPSAD